jgi:arylsulfatase A-like enzyme
MRRTILGRNVALLLAASFPACTAPSAPKRPPNVILIVADDLGYGDLGCYGSKIPTPNLDRLAQQGARLTDFHVAQAVCGASRAAILTGCYPNRISIQGAPNHTVTTGIAARETTIAEMLRARGYATGMVGKWHLGHLPQFLPTKNGFDQWFGLPYSNDMGPKPGTYRKDFPPLPLFDGDTVVEENPSMDTLTTRYTERAVQFVEQNRDRPFFLYFPHAMPHVPLGVHPTRKGATGQGLYADVIHEVDWSVGEVLAAVDRTGNTENTIVVFTSDNGPWESYGNHAGSSGGLRESKGTTFEGGIRVPCIVRWPGTVQPGTTVLALGATMDLLPTIASATGAALPTLPIDGVDFTPALRGEGIEPRATMLCYWGKSLEAVREGRWKLHFAHNHRTQKGPAGQDGESRGESSGKIEESLFDLATDPGERTNVAAQHPDIVARLKALADRARSDLGDAMTKVEGKGVRPADDAKPK